MDASSLADLRSLLIFAGQLEQAVWDSALEEDHVSFHLRDASAELTDSVARFFCRKFVSDETGVEQGFLIDAVGRMASLLTGASTLERHPVTVKIPEGYAFYALFPEQYCAAALNWVRQRASGNEALVVGVRSIGTSLSAVVKETLCQSGWKASRFTVRPTGHPFQRKLELNTDEMATDKPILIVDEGPGISGSSMAAVAEAFISVGCNDVSFFSGHGNDPSGASSQVMEMWRRVPRYVTPMEELEWDRLSLEESLLARAKKFGGQAKACDSIQNISGGLWQKVV